MVQDPKVVMIAVDGSPMALEAAHYGLRLTKRMGARAHIVHVVEFAPQMVASSAGLSAWALALPAARSEARACVDLVAHEAVTEGVPYTVQVVDAHDAASGILAEAGSEEVGLIVVGSHGRTGLARAILGSVAEKVVRGARCPVLVVR
jgi:nucleotide-binding universal stress UspA family protein